MAKKRGPASRISTRGRGELGTMKGEAGVDTQASQSVYSATIERRTVMSSGFPPTMKMKMYSYILKGKKKKM